ncbi:hypothetical protein CHS0354_021347 [Potamilus streckersoni]|uniref:Mab-21-like HhH/H2TH-like domain-containing protein n=1 Tax=Potamilus streckersoni TaxID=2493646 RepID=A0AAE0S3U3_9BIVA|nr:hypothetical protein CHS0354_021347 [Potamilus streckersoni]
MDVRILDYYLPLSRRLSRILNEVGYSREDRERKVTAANYIEVFTNVANDFAKAGLHENWYSQHARENNAKTSFADEVFVNLFHEFVQFGLRHYMFGSRSEGSTGPGLHSDRDVLLQYDGFKTVEDLFDCDPGRLNFLMLKDSSTHPGYVKLAKVDIFNRSLISHILRYRTDLHGNDILSKNCFDNILNFSYYLGLLPDYEQTGPAIHIPAANKIYSCDTVIAVRFSRWPREGYEWFLRYRPYGWPTLEQIQTSSKYGCFATQIGHPCSFEQDLEWRLSFSIAERELVRSFDDTTMYVYILLKMVKKTFIQPVIGDKFSSYHCKVCMLWMREKTPQELWRTGNLLLCLHLCLRQLYEWASLGCCPDYFIVSNNLYDRNIFGQTRVQLQRILGDLLSQNCRFLLGIECCEIGELLANGLTSVDRGCQITVTEGALVEVDCDYRLIAGHESYCRYLFMNFTMANHISLFKYLIKIQHAIQHAPLCIHAPLRHILILLFAQLGFYLAVVYAEHTQLWSEEEIMNILTLISICLYNGVHSDASSVRLKVCGMALKFGDCDSAEVCLQGISDKQSSYTYILSLDEAQIIRGVVSNTQKLLSERYSTEELLQYRISFCVVYQRSEISITPHPLRMEMFRSVGLPPGCRVLCKHFWYDWAVVDSVFCLHFLQYLNFCRQGKRRHKQAAMNNMWHLTKTEPIIQHGETRLNLFGYCLIQEDKHRAAYKCFTESLGIRPYHNSAKFYLGILFQKVFAARRIQEAGIN